MNLQKTANFDLELVIFSRLKNNLIVNYSIKFMEKIKNSSNAMKTTMFCQME